MDLLKTNQYKANATKKKNAKAKELKNILKAFHSDHSFIHISTFLNKLNTFYPISIYQAIFVFHQIN